jgi:membrane-bound lytic murein transglycosylase F
MNHLLTLTIALACFFAGCQNNHKSGERKTKIPLSSTKKDLDDIKQDGVLKAITVYSSTSYFLYRGQPMGFEYDLLKELAEYLELDLQIIVAQNIDELFTMLNKGEGDIIAHGLTITRDRKKIAHFTDYLYLTHQVLVQKKPEHWMRMKIHEIQKEIINDPIQLIGDTVSVRKNSSYYHRLINLQDEIGGKIHIDTISGNISTDKIIQQVVDGEIEYTIADNNIAEINSSYYPILDIETEMSFSQRIAWAVRKNSPEFLEVVNKWVNNIKKEVDYYVIYNKYFKSPRSFERRIQSEFYSQNTGRISQYDDIIKKYAKKINWDWRFVSSVIYQESQFNPHANSWANARGLMQLMPRTAKELGVKDITNPEENIRGGTQYLQNMWKKWKNIPDSIQRIKFTLASYNCGYSHVVDAQKLAEKHKAETNVWDGQVEQYLLNLSYPEYYNDKIVKYGYVRGIEPVTYVKQIFKRYEHYRELIPK